MALRKESNPNVKYQFPHHVICGIGTPNQFLLWLFAARIPSERYVLYSWCSNRPGSMRSIFQLKLPSSLGPDGVITVVRLSDYTPLALGETMVESSIGIFPDTRLLALFYFPVFSFLTPSLFFLAGFFFYFYLLGALQFSSPHRSPLFFHIL